MSAICRLSAPLAVSIFRVAETTTIGTVDKVQAHVDATQAGQTRGRLHGRDCAGARGRPGSHAGALSMPATRLRGQPPPLAKATGLSRHAIYRIQSDPAWANDVLAAWVA